ncbi:hypothetical protein HPB47_010165 [Ixodes persulcatus]|uniref:Uncharacterized protein n=1 Tax=Ixodes persulcatus TaxID=34615 RepID=A0AC60P014_IXOPE|nr:hypothetical protein HPB47_010165 [Ixodes persulcatus]
MHRAVTPTPLKPGKARFRTATGDSGGGGGGGGGSGADSSVPGTRERMKDITLRVSSIELPDARLSSDERCNARPSNGKMKCRRYCAGRAPRSTFPAGDAWTLHEDAASTRFQPGPSATAGRVVGRGPRSLSKVTENHFQEQTNEEYPSRSTASARYFFPVETCGPAWNVAVSPVSFVARRRPPHFQTKLELSFSPTVAVCTGCSTKVALPSPDDGKWPYGARGSSYGQL